MFGLSIYTNLHVNIPNTKHTRSHMFQYLQLVSDLFFAQSDNRILNVYFMKTANILVYGYITVYGYVLNY